MIPGGHAAMARAHPGEQVAQGKAGAGRRLYLLAAVPMVLAVAGIAAFVAWQARETSAREIAALIEAKKAELKNYLSMARTAFGIVYGNARPDDERAKREVAQTMAAMVYGRDGQFFIFDYDGTNIVAPRQTWLINRNWRDLADSTGTPVVARLIELARQGGAITPSAGPSRPPARRR